MLEHTKALLGVVAPLLVGWGATVTWPQASPELVWSLAVLASFAWLAIHYRSRLPRLRAVFPLPSISKKDNPRDLIPFVDAADMVCLDIKAVIRGVLGERDNEKTPLIRHLWNEMIEDTKNSVPLYAIWPPSTKRGLIENSHKYELNEDLVTATNPFAKDRNTLTNLYVRRRDVKRWLKNYLSEVDGE